VAAGSFRGDIYIIDVMKQYKAVQHLRTESSIDKILSIQWHPSFNYIIASASADTIVRVWDTKNVTLSFLIAFREATSSLSATSRGCEAYHGTSRYHGYS